MKKTPNSLKKDHRQMIIDAAEQLFSQKAFDSVTTSEIARKSGVSKANIYYHFSNKKNLYMAVLGLASQAIRKDLSAALKSEHSIVNTLNEFVRNHLNSMLLKPHLVRLLWREITEEGSHRAQDFAEQGFLDIFLDLVELIKLGQTQGEVRSDFDPAVAATLLLGANVFFFQSHDILRHYPHVTFADDPNMYDTAVMGILLQGMILSRECD
ncbi:MULTISPECIES: TetR/AcrR family transcriptional regulator [Acidithiobacillus]|uniref:TetR/AcrR family transcriptional regulator n=1 Tax=Acidithiobacillus TaxID=119977 RepID=UPI0009DB01F1|nr:MULTISPECIES: TetR/AcrR family transcriptional regulator [Acidithiobacillus]MDA8177576.1 TetR/AcrR family transcriptional regulator [Acidithiobacillus sp.]